MTTFIFILVILFLIFIVNFTIRERHSESNLSSKENDELLNKKTKPVLVVGLVFLILGVIIINYSNYFKTEEEIQSVEIERIEDSVQKSLDSIVNLPTAPLTTQQKFLKDNGFNENADFTNEQFNEFKLLVKSDLFKEESFCEVFQKSLDILNNSKNSKADLKKLYRKYQKIPYFETIISSYGFKFCSAKSLKDQSKDSKTYINSDESANPCVISEDFIKQDLYNPSTADFSMFDCTTEKNADGTYTILRKVSAENSLGVEKEFIYKLRLGFSGGNWVDMSNWTLIKIQSEEYK